MIAGGGVEPPYDYWQSTLTDGSFEDVYEALTDVVAQLEDAQLPLADSLACYELGMRLAERCERFLEEAELRISRLDELGSGDVVPADDFDIDDEDL
jgi:exodeoxyribonuclease VII small subunit